MSRSNPHEHGIPNPAARWFEWNGEKGVVRYYDKLAKQTVEVGSEFTFLMLDQLGTVKGWHESSKSGIYANEVKDSRQERLVVKAFKIRDPLAEGFYKDIKDRVSAVGGYYVASCYIAVKNGGDALGIANFGMHGAALNAWVEFAKQHRSDLYEGAVKIDGYTEGKKGRIVYRVPAFKIVPLSEDTNRQAIALDEEVQGYLAVRLNRPTSDQVDEQSHDEPPPYEQATSGRDEYSPVTDDDIPF